MKVSFLSLSVTLFHSLSSDPASLTLPLSPFLSVFVVCLILCGFGSSQAAAAAAQKRNSQNSLHMKTASIVCSLTQNYGSCFAAAADVVVVVAIATVA